MIIADGYNNILMLRILSMSEVKHCIPVVGTPFGGQSTSSCWPQVEPPPQKLEVQFECPLLSRGEAQSQLERAFLLIVQKMVVLMFLGAWC